MTEGSFILGPRSMESENAKSPWNEKEERVVDVARNESGIGSNVSRPRAFSALSPARATLMDALIGGISRGMRRKDRSYY